MTSIEPELWVENPGEALRFYEAAFGATILHRVGEGDDIVAQLGIGNAAFWVAASSATMKRLSPLALDGATGRTLLVVEPGDRGSGVVPHGHCCLARGLACPALTAGKGPVDMAGVRLPVVS